MLQTDEIILGILQDEKKDGNELLQKFKLGFPNKQIAQESNSIFVAAVDSESYNEGENYSQYRDMVEILIVTKKREHSEAIDIIKVACREIVRLIYKNSDRFVNKPVARNITPDYGTNFVANRGHIMVQVVTAPFSFEKDDADIERVCQLLVDDIEEV